MEATVKSNRNTHRLPRGGHAPGYMREAFLEAVEAYYESGAEEPLPIVTIAPPPRMKRNPLRLIQRPEKSVDLRAMCGLMWNCSDILPRSERESINEICASMYERTDVYTFAQGARALRRHLQVGGVVS